MGKIAAPDKVGLTQSNVNAILTGIKIDEDHVVNEEESGKEDSSDNDDGRSNNSDRGGQGLLFSMSDCD